MFLRKSVLSQYANFLADLLAYDPQAIPEAARTEAAEKLVALDDEVQRLVLAVPGRGAVGEWFERNGDQLQDDRESARWYELGTESSPEWAQLWFKGIGALTFAGQNRDQLVERFRRHVLEYGRPDGLGESTAIRTLMNRAQNQRRRQRLPSKTGSNRGQDRLELGLKVVAEETSVQVPPRRSY